MQCPRVAALLGAAARFVPKQLPGLPVAEAWARSGRLTPAAVGAAHRGAMTVKRSPDPHFMYNEVGVSDRLPDAGGVGSRTEFVDMDPADFVRALELQDGQSPPFHYYTCGVLQHAPGFADEVSALDRCYCTPDSADSQSLPSRLAVLSLCTQGKHTAPNHTTSNGR